MRFLIVLMMSYFLFANPAFAKKDHTNKRQAHQSARIKKGKKSGEISKAEGKHLKAEGRHIKRAEKRAKRDGKVSPKEARHLNKLQNKRSKDIAKAKHNETKAEAKPVEDAQSQTVPTEEVDTTPQATPGTGTDTAAPVQEDPEIQE